MSQPFVIAGLDPAIHTEGRHALRFIMDAADLGLVRGPNNEMPKSDISDLGFKPAHDDGDLSGRVTNEKIQCFMLLNRNLSFRAAPQAAEISSIFRFRAVMNPCAKPFYLNQKVKP